MSSPVLASVVPPGYSLQHIHMAYGQGGGVAVIHKTSLRIEREQVKSFKTFEMMHLNLMQDSSTFHFVII